MDLRLKSFGASSGEPTSLPHGTEVVLRTPRQLGERTVPVGTVGRVMKTHAGGVDVAIVGLGTLTCDRADLTARRVGQMLFAKRRELAWSALRPCVVIETEVGSRAWGLADEASDHDRRGVFALPLTWTTGIVTPPEDLISDDGSSTYWSVRKCITQALRADPNTLEALFVRSATALDDVGAWLLEEREAFVSTEIYGTFGRYALAQLHRLQQGARLHEHRALVLAWARDEPELTLDRAAERLADLTPKAFPRREDAVLQSKQWLKQLYRSLADQGLIPAADWLSLTAFARNGAAELDLPRELRPKNAYNLLRLLFTARGWLETGEPVFEVTGALRARLLDIKRGNVQLDEVLAEAEAMMPSLDEARASSRLPRRPDLARADRVQRRILEELARRHSQRAPGPWGSDAPEPPRAEWQED